MGLPGATVGRYHLRKTIGNGSFAKVKLAMDVETGEKVAVKVIDKKRVVQGNLVDQVKREISTMKLLHHPNIVRIYEVIATKTTIFLVMEYVPGGNLAEKLTYRERLQEDEARKYFQQLIDAADYCHGMGIYHRDLKPHNLLIDSKGNLKVSDFGLSMLIEGHGKLLSTTCGSPNYVAPEVCAAYMNINLSKLLLPWILKKHVPQQRSYEGAGSDIWSCGVILFELLAGKIPFDDDNRTNLFRKITRARYDFPEWFTNEQKRLICKILDPNPTKRITLPEILKDGWFRVGYKPSLPIQTISSGYDHNGSIEKNSKDSNFINAFQLIAMSDDLDLSRLFEEEENYQNKIKLASEHSLSMTMEKIEAAAKDLSLSIGRARNSTVTLHGIKELKKSRSHIMLSAEVTAVTPTHCVVELSKSAGVLGTYKELCRSLSNVLKDGNSSPLPELQFSESDSNNGEDDGDGSRKGEAVSQWQNSSPKSCASI